MGLTRLALERPVAITMLFLALAFMGVVAYTRLPVQRFPNTSFPTIRVTVSYPGAAPEDVEALVTKRIEDAVVGISGIDRITSDSNQGSSNVQIAFAEGADINVALAEVSRKVGAVRRSLPTGAGDPSIIKGDPSDFPIMNISISSDQLDLPTLTTLVDNQIQPLIQSVNGVADVNRVGGANRQIEVRVDPLKLVAYGVSLTQVQTAVANQNIGLPGGTVRTTTQVVNTRTDALAQQPSDLADIVVNTPTGGGVAAVSQHPVFLRNVAEVVDTTKFQRSFQRLNGNTSVGLIITKQSGANEIQVAQLVRQAVKKIEASMGQSGLRFEVVNDTSRFTTAALDDVQRDLYLAMLITALVLLLFLHTLRNTGMVLVAIPTSLLATFLIMFFFGFSLDIMSLMALALLVGILVDDSIVVLENINRHLGLEKSPWQAALDGRSEIGLAAIAITATDVVVYTPVAFMAGNIGQLFREFGLTIVAATVLSLLVSFTLTPMLASRLLSGEALEHITGRGPWAAITQAWERAFSAIRRAYRRLIGVALNVRWLPMLLGAASLGLAIAFIPLHVLGTEFVPSEDDNQFNINLQMPVGTSIDATDRAVRQLENAFRPLPEVLTVFASVGGGGGQGGGNEQNASVTVGLVDKSARGRSVLDLMGEARAIGARIPGATIRTSAPAPLSGGFGTPINLVITGPDFDQLQAIANQALEIVRTTPGTAEARTSRIAPAPEYRVVVNRDKAADQGVTAQTIANTLNTAVQGFLASELRPEGRTQTDIVVLLAGAETMTPDQIGAIPVLTSKGTIVRLDQVGDIVYTSSPSQIARYNRLREIEVQASVTDRSLGDVLRDIQEQTRQLPLPPGYSIAVSGQGNQLSRAFGALTQALVMSVVLLYMLMAALYGSFLLPFAVMLCLPVALVGAFLGLLLMHETINIFSMIGMIMLVGLVAKNAILLVDYTNTLRGRGVPRREALMEAGATRLRPILMTTLTMVFAMLPLAINIGSGSESRSPMAVVVIGGLITSTLLTLVLVPCAYTYLDDLAGLTLRLRRRPQPVPSWSPPPRTGEGEGGGDLPTNSPAAPVLAGTRDNLGTF